MLIAEVVEHAETNVINLPQGFEKGQVFTPTFLASWVADLLKEQLGEDWSGKILIRHAVMVSCWMQLSPSFQNRNCTALTSMLRPQGLRGHGFAGQLRSRLLTCLCVHLQTRPGNHSRSARWFLTLLGEQTYFTPENR